MITAEELRDLFIVYNAAKFWWERHRPIKWTLAEHLELPSVNTATSAEGDLARAVARIVKASAERAKAVK